MCTYSSTMYNMYSQILSTVHGVSVYKCCWSGTIWSMENFEYSKDSASCYDMDGSIVFQPELNGFYLFQLEAGNKLGNYNNSNS